MKSKVSSMRCCSNGNAVQVKVFYLFESTMMHAAK